MGTFSRRCGHFGRHRVRPALSIGDDFVASTSTTGRGDHMRIFQGLQEAYHEIERDLLEVGEWQSGYSYQDKVIEDDPDFDFMEMRPYAYIITHSSWNSLRDYAAMLELNQEWIEAEFEERIQGGHNPGQAWALRRDTWHEFLEPDGTFAYTYSKRMGLRDQVLKVVVELERHPASRQGIIGIWNPVLDIGNIGGRSRVPCSMFYHVMVRNEAVDLHYVMRSCDFYLHFPYDQILAIMLRNHIADRMRRPYGIFSHFITSFHAYRRDFGEEVF